MNDFLALSFFLCKINNNNNSIKTNKITISLVITHPNNSKTYRPIILILKDINFIFSS